MYHFLVDFTRFTVNPAVTGSSPCFSQKRFRAFAEADETEGSPLPIFFRHCATFFSIFPGRIGISPAAVFIFFEGGGRNNIDDMVRNFQISFQNSQIDIEFNKIELPW